MSVLTVMPPCQDDIDLLLALLIVTNTILNSNIRIRLLSFMTMQFADQQMQ